jgi:hypothetical protein
MGEACGAAMASGRRISEFTARRGVPASAVEALPRVFDEEEQAFAAASLIMSYPAGRPGTDLRIWAPPELAPRFGFLLEEDAIRLLENGEVDAIILDRRLEGSEPAHAYYGKFFLYVRTAGPAPSPAQER